MTVLGAGFDPDHRAYVSLPQGAVLDDATPVIEHDNYSYLYNVNDVNPIVVLNGEADRPLPQDELVKDVPNDPARPGQVIFVNNGDVDGDGVPGFADGFDLFGNQGAQASGNFQEVKIYIPSSINLDRARVKLIYPESRPDQVTRTANPDGTYSYQPGSGKIRLWRKDGGQSRTVAGDYLESGKIYSAYELGFRTSNGGSPSVRLDIMGLYAEGIQASTSPGDVRIEFWVDPDGENYPADFIGFDAARLTILESRLVKVGENNSITPVTKIETSHASPVISLSALTLNNVGPSVPDYQSIVGQLAIAGTVTCAACDVYPDGVVSEVRVFVNSSDTPAAVFPLTVSKDYDPASYLHRYPFSGSFSEELEAELELGVNLIRVVATDNVMGIVGYSEWTVEVTGQYMPPLALSFSPLSYSSGTMPKALSAQVSIPGGIAVSAVLTNTLANPNYFVGSVGSFSLGEGGESIFSILFDQLTAFNDSFVDLYSGTVTCDNLGVSQAPVVVVEGAAASRSFTHDGTLLPSWLNWVFQPGAIAHLKSSTGGQGFWHSLNIRGPKDYLERVQRVSLLNSYGGVESLRKLFKSSDGQYFVGCLMTNQIGPAMIFSCPVLNIANTLGQAIQGNTSQLDYNAGFAVGFAKGFGSLIEGSARMAVVWGPHGFLLFQGERMQDVQAGLNLLVTSWAAQQAIQQFFVEWRARQLSDIYSTQASPGDAALRVVSEDGRLMAEFAKELVIFLNQHAPGNTYDAGKLHGRVAFEVASMLVAELKAGQLASMSKVSFYGKLATRLETKSFPLVEEARAATAAAKAHVEPSEVLRQRVVANIKEGRKARLTSSFEIFDRKVIARNFFESAGYSPAAVESRMRAINFRLDVKVTRLPAGTEIVQWQIPGRPIGNYFAPPGTPGHILGIYTSGRIPVVYRTTSEVEVLESVAARTVDDWSMREYDWKIDVSGGGTQYFIETKALAPNLIPIR